jgi:UDP:flavonoid glycosyltransferase YjiC (YdhE family)
MAALAGIEAAVTVGTGGFDFNIPECPQDQVQIVPWRVISAEYKPDLIIHHGGHGACLTAISAGIPSVVIPTHAEREYNASHLAALGCGEVVPLEQTDLARLRHAVEGMLDNRVCADRCAQWSQTIATRKYAGADAAARMILAML